jgi:hypothetical protein
VGLLLEPNYLYSRDWLEADPGESEGVKAGLALGFPWVAAVLSVGVGCVAAGLVI